MPILNAHKSMTEIGKMRKWMEWENESEGERAKLLTKMLEYIFDIRYLTLRIVEYECTFLPQSSN